MYKEILRSIDNIAIWPVISFVIFFLFFLMLLWHVFATDNSLIDKMKHLPMDDSDSISTNPSSNPKKI